MMRKRYLYFENFDQKNSISQQDLIDAKEDTKNVLNFIGISIDIFTVIHLFLSGLALGYIIILIQNTNLEIWYSYFGKIIQKADYFFYLSTYICFIYIFLLVGVLHIIKWNDLYLLISLYFCLTLLGISLFFSTYSIPMSHMLIRSNNIDKYWYKTINAKRNILPLLYTTYKRFSIFRMISIIITSPISSFFVHQLREISFNKLNKMF